MQYKTIILEMLEDRADLYERLRKEGTLLATMERLSGDLKAAHGRFEDDLRQRSPFSSDAQVSSAAMELAVSEMETILDSMEPPNDTSAFDLDDAMAFLRKHAPPE